MKLVTENDHNELLNILDYIKVRYTTDEKYSD
jgi:hypothetical protein